MKYINLENTTDNKLADGTPWIDFFWSNLDAIQRVEQFHFSVYCPCCGTVYSDTNPQVGAHVAYQNTRNLRAYIVPLCDTCNKKGGVVEVDDSVTPVAVPRNSPHYGDICYPKETVKRYKEVAPSLLADWDGRVR